MRTIEELRPRVLKGNEWCRDLWKRCQNTAGQDDLWKQNMLALEKGSQKLERLCTELEAAGWTACLYETMRCKEHWDEITCWACPLTPWPAKENPETKQAWDELKSANPNHINTDEIKW